MTSYKTLMEILQNPHKPLQNPPNPALEHSCSTHKDRYQRRPLIAAPLGLMGLLSYWGFWGMVGL